MKKILHLVVSLTVISAVCAAVLATVNQVTKDQIATIKVRAKENAARKVMPASVKRVEKAKTCDGGEMFVGRNAAGEAIAYALTGLDPLGYGGDVVLMVGFTADLAIVTYQKLEASETPGLGMNLTTPEFMKQFRGMSAKTELKVTKDGGDVEAITSATITSRAVCGAINSAAQRLAKTLRK